MADREAQLGRRRDQGVGLVDAQRPTCHHPVRPEQDQSHTAPQRADVDEGRRVLLGGVDHDAQQPDHQVDGSRDPPAVVVRERVGPTNSDRFRSSGSSSTWSRSATAGVSSASLDSLASLTSPTVPLRPEGSAIAGSPLASSGSSPESGSGRRVRRIGVVPDRSQGSPGLVQRNRQHPRLRRDPDEVGVAHPPGHAVHVEVVGLRSPRRLTEVDADVDPLARRPS